MSDPEVGGAASEAAASETCAQCGTTLSPEDRVEAGDRVFCRSCHASLRSQLEQAIAEMGSNINYVNATIGALLGGIAGAVVWWGFTVLTHFSVGLVAIAIGFLVGHGAVRFAGGKRSAGLQALAVSISLASYLVATFLVNMTFVNKALSDQGDSFRVAFPPQSIDLFARVLSLDFGLMDVVFLAIVIYQAWKIPQPLSLPTQAA